MRKVSILAACVLALGIIAAPTLAGEDCSCKEIKKVGYGYCKGCSTGTLFGVKLSSAKLYDALAGHDMDMSKVKCSGCKAAAKTNGTCDKCNVSIADGKAYHSMASYSLALGKEVKTDKIKCKSCKEAAYNNGFCEGCSKGMVAHRMFKPRSQYDAAKNGLALITKAASAKCEGCAVAMVQDGTCASCKLAFKGGKKV